MNEKETLPILNKMFTVYTFMMDNEKKRVEEVEAEKEKNKEEGEMNTNSGQHREINQSWNEGHKINEIQSGINNVMAEHQRNIGESGATKSR